MSTEPAAKPATDLELATNDELIAELLGRSTFCGLLIWQLVPHKVVDGKALYGGIEVQARWASRGYTREQALASAGDLYRGINSYESWG